MSSILIPESFVVVGCDEEIIWCKYPNKEKITIRWSELIGVAIENTDKGPQEPDVFFILASKNGVLIYPQGATGESELLKKLLELPGFKYEELYKAMICTDNKTTICWERTTEKTEAQKKETPTKV